MAETLHGESDSESEDNTHVGDVFDVLGSVADKVLALDRGEEAERILSAVLLSILREAKEGRDVSVSIAERAAGYAVRIAFARPARAGSTTWSTSTASSAASCPPRSSISSTTWCVVLAA
jgi:hypothetical protein